MDKINILIRKLKKSKKQFKKEPIKRKQTLKKHPA
jgi:hypothetical protein